MATSAASKPSVCDLCPHAYECGKLFCALEILGAGPPKLPDPHDVEHAELVELLAEAKFSYPESNRVCRLHGSTGTIRSLTEVAIRILDRRRRATQNAVAIPAAI